ETLRSAQNSRARSSLAALPDVNRRTIAGIRSRSESCFSPRRNFFETSWNWIAASAMLDALREHRFRLVEDEPAQHQRDSGAQHRVAEPHRIGRAVVKHGGGQQLQHGSYRIQHQHVLPLGKMA